MTGLLKLDYWGAAKAEHKEKWVSQVRIFLHIMFKRGMQAAVQYSHYEHFCKALPC